VSTFIIALGLVAVIEGLVLVLAPSRFEELVRVLAAMSLENRRLLGLLFVAIGAVIIWAVQLL
tara:strand:+ start:1876 stop:2064 length:189 start_codon:yes stop_codon:yes gene_type:complete